MKVTERSILIALSTNGQHCINEDCKRPNLDYVLLARDAPDLPHEKVTCRSCGATWEVALHHSKIIHISNKEATSVPIPASSMYNNQKMNLSARAYLHHLRVSRKLINDLKEAKGKLRPVNVEVVIQALDKITPKGEALNI